MVDTEKILLSSLPANDAKNVEFDERSFVEKGEGGSRENQRRVFVESLKRWIENYQGSGVEKFCLAFSHPEDYLQAMEKSIQFAVKGEVKVLDLDFSDPSWSEESVETTHETFLQLPLHEGHEMLEALKLYSCNLPLVSGFSTFSALKSISLGWINLASSAIIQNLSSKCPTLEVLSFKKCNLGYFELTAPNLKTLIIDKCYPPDMIVLTAPKLRSFKYSGTVTVFDFKCTLEEAELDFGIEQFYAEEDGNMLCNMLYEISSAKTLTVCSFLLQVIACGDEPISMKPAIENVRHLILKTALDRNEFYGITFLLNSCPNLQYLTIDLVPAKKLKGYDPQFRIEYHAFVSAYPWKPTYQCVDQSLSTITVKGFKGLPDELSVLGYFLRYGKVLDRMLIGFPGKGSAEEQATSMDKVQSLRQIQRSPRQHVGVFSCS